jgi:hypothetical protein
VNPNEQQRATLDGLIFFEHDWAVALRDKLFLRSATLFPTNVHHAHCTQNALQRNKNGYVATTGISVGRP